MKFKRRTPEQFREQLRRSSISQDIAEELLLAQQKTQHARQNSKAP